MPRQARVNFAGRHYVTNSSKKGLSVFRGENNKAQFFEILCKSCKRYDARILAFCITDSEYHLIISLDKPNLPLLMRQISATYSIFFNSEAKKRGSIWHDRYKSWVINDKNDLFLIQKYIAHIPVIKKIKKYPEEYKYSSFSTILDTNEMLSCLDEEKKNKGVEITQKGNFTEEDLMALKQFKRIRPQLKSKEKKEKNIEPIEKIIKKFKTLEKRNKRIKKAFAAGHTQNEIARFLGISQSSVSKIVNRDVSHLDVKN